MSSSPESRRERTPAGGVRRRWLLGAALALALVEGLYLLLANGFLSSSYGQRLLNRRPEKLQVSWGSAWTVWPGRVHLRALHLRSQSRGARWELELDRASCAVSLPALAAKRFSARDVAGRGLGFRLLRRPRPGEPAPPEGSAPVISGFPGPVETPAGGTAAPQRRRSWKLSLAGIAVDDIREIWIHRLRWEGDGRLTGGLEMEIRGPLEIRPTRIELSSGQILSGDEIVSDKARLRLEARSGRFVPRENRGLAALGFLSGHLSFESPRTDFGFLNYYFQRAPWIDVGGTGEVRADVGVERGELLPGSLVTVDARSLALDALGFAAGGSGDIRAEVAAAGAGIATRLAARLDGFELADDRSDGDGGETLVRGAGLELVAHGEEADLVRGFGDLDVEVSIPPSEVPDLTAFNAFLPAASDLRIGSGQGSFHGRLSLDSGTHSGSGEVEVRGEGVGLSFDNAVVVGDVKVSARLRDADLLARRFDVSGSRVELEHFAVDLARRGAEETGWWARLELREGELRLRERPPSIDGAISAEIRDSGPLAAYIAERKPRIPWLKKILTVEDVSASARLTTGPETLTVGDLRITGEKLEILATGLNLTQGRRDGLFFFKLGPLSAALEIDGEGRQWKLTRSRRWYEERAEETRSGAR